MICILLWYAFISAGVNAQFVSNVWLQPATQNLNDLLRYSEERTTVNNFVNTYELSTFATLVKRVNLFDALTQHASSSNMHRKYTVFAPVNAAFADLPPFLISYLQKNPALLKKVLLYHVVPAELLVKDFDGGQDKQFLSVEGSILKPKVIGMAHVQINDANLLKPFDLFGIDGVLHLIDKVLVAPDVQIPKCNDRCRFVIKDDVDMAALSEDDRGKFCNIQCSNSGSGSGSGIGIGSNNKLLSNGKSSSNEQNSNSHECRYDYEEDSRKKGKDALEPSEHLPSFIKHFKNIQGITKDNMGSNFKLEFLPILKKQLQLEEGKEYNNVGDNFERCTTDCIAGSLLEANTNKFVLTTLQKQIVGEKCMQTCNVILKHAKGEIEAPKSINLCMNTCKRQGVDGKRCSVLCKVASEVVGKNPSAAYRETCSLNCASSSLDFATCTSECVMKQYFSKEIIKGQPTRLLNDKQRAFFENRINYYMKNVKN